MSIQVSNRIDEFSTAGQFLGVGMWVTAIATYGVGDVATTIYFLQAGVATESHPIAAPVIDAIGVWILAPWKAAAIAFFYGLYRKTPQVWRIGVPIGLLLLGSVLTVWNLLIGLRSIGLL